MQAFGWIIDCEYSNKSHSIDETTPTTTPIDLFSMNITEKWDESGGYKLHIQTLHKTEYGCTSNYTVSQCSLEPSTARYKLFIKGDQALYRRNETVLETNITTLDILDAKWSPYTYIDPGEPTTVKVIYYPSWELPEEDYTPQYVGVPLQDRRLKPFKKTGQDVYGTYFGATRDHVKWYMGDDDDGSGYRSFLAHPYRQRKDQDRKSESPCTLRFRSPMEDILEWYQEVALRVSVLAAEEKKETRRVRFYGETTEEVDKIRHMALFVVCVVLAYVPAVCIAVMEWGWEQLPREFNGMDPLDLAYMLLHQNETPGSTTLLDILAQAPSKASNAELIAFAEKWDEDTGGKPVKFGLVEVRYGIDVNLGQALVKALDESESDDDDIEMGALEVCNADDVEAMAGMEGNEETVA